jgi:hypothetical protein
MSGLDIHGGSNGHEPVDVLDLAGRLWQLKLDETDDETESCEDDVVHPEPADMIHPSVPSNPLCFSPSGVGFLVIFSFFRVSRGLASF